MPRFFRRQYKNALNDKKSDSIKCNCITKESEPSKESNTTKCQNKPL